MSEIGRMITEMETEVEKRKRENALREAQLAENKRKNAEYEAWRKGRRELDVGEDAWFKDRDIPLGTTTTPFKSGLTFLVDALVDDAA